MAVGTSTVHIVDDDPSVARALARLIRSAGFVVDTFASAESYLAAGPKVPNCLVVDVGLPGMSGLELAAMLTQRTAGLPVIVITAHDDVLVRQAASSAGAAGFYPKPLSCDGFLQAVENAAAQSAQG